MSRERSSIIIGVHVEIVRGESTGRGDRCQDVVRVLVLEPLKSRYIRCRTSNGSRGEKKTGEIGV